MSIKRHIIILNSNRSNIMEQYRIKHIEKGRKCRQKCRKERKNKIEDRDETNSTIESYIILQ